MLSGNRNFEARVHQSIKANFLMSPPLVVAFALAGTGRHRPDSPSRSAGTRDGRPVYLRDIWPSTRGGPRRSARRRSTPATYRRLYADFAAQNPLWNEIPSAAGKVYAWDADSTYIQEPPFFEGFGLEPAAVERHPRRPGRWRSSATR